MRIPRRIEWRAGAALLGASAVLLAVALVLSLARIDVGLSVEGSLYRTSGGKALSFTLPAGQLDLLRRCRYVRIDDGRGQSWRGPIVRMSGLWEREREGVWVQLRIEGEGLEALMARRAQRVRIALVERRASVLKALGASAFGMAGRGNS